MRFQDRNDAGKKLGNKLKNIKEIREKQQDLIVLSLVRGGAPVGYEVAKILQAPHYPLIVKKIGAPHREELAIGAVCDEEVFLNNSLINQAGYSEDEVEIQIEKARYQELHYKRRFKIVLPQLQGKIVIVVDDGVATGASVYAACKCISSKNTKRIYLAVPVAPIDFRIGNGSMFNSGNKCFDKIIIFHEDPYFNAVGQYYSRFEQINDSKALSFYKMN
ncbi:hypothetical protein A3H80_02035 [Candidatus Roizmanbacteria bacterium RIFCSPLOWO2_02_FULL_37_19]|uniref:Phosphoribosyltransferase domain-containing protein n=1 Tax=Candidatus Roizmanbacteria bacterium RIFCSPHIGHO2_02_FULL_37_24 TaxID=1802037 RepID=A0A1F7H0Q7_9BACT|nr:MAG: hypothetical protein A2862_02620 [Candidatus Roizmanbacteria bacterium RIFCSPHIGHO2_01_FULL_38_41]OGK24514.1 MAG: hypothetical protein A3C24_03115 [Candidatus Roizmanbacteria bacterium RIFCSPHIGHO2_02_FULL_37_24]OGK31968.1 MAG: hypothetical protein A3E10_04455 [Candidatus Roizmanbacteria bacterium RIFCSPHIGHO2_12_FULL_37_23]OGK43769.1 MAG: hypothetical protein A2956_04580 [Candidatus Roizmanbacteria bacterium RIFCSPLOWO2_01_FULL_37_57]OGK54323.1 MAG: hypothetical protein A3H80_02035 [Ca